MVDVALHGGALVVDLDGRLPDGVRHLEDLVQHHLLVPRPAQLREVVVDLEEARLPPPARVEQRHELAAPHEVKVVLEELVALDQGDDARRQRRRAPLDDAVEEEKRLVVVALQEAVERDQQEHLHREREEVDARQRRGLHVQMGRVQVAVVAQGTKAGGPARRAERRVGLALGRRSAGRGARDERVPVRVIHPRDGQRELQREDDAHEDAKVVQLLQVVTGEGLADPTA